MKNHTYALFLAFCCISCNNNSSSHKFAERDPGNNQNKIAIDSLTAIKRPIEIDTPSIVKDYIYNLRIAEIDTFDYTLFRDTTLNHYWVVFLESAVENITNVTEIIEGQNICQAVINEPIYARARIDTSYLKLILNDLKIGANKGNAALLLSRTNNIKYLPQLKKALLNTTDKKDGGKIEFTIKMIEDKQFRIKELKKIANDRIGFLTEKDIRQFKSMIRKAKESEAMGNKLLEKNK